MHEKEMNTVTHYLRKWRRYLLKGMSVVKMDNISTSYISTHPIFHVIQLGATHLDPKGLEYTEPRTALANIIDRPKWEVDKVHVVRIVGFKNGVRREYLLSWVGRPLSNVRWEREEALWRYEDKVNNFFGKK